MARRLTQEEFVGRVYKLEGDKYTVIGEYVNADTKIDMKHNECGNIYPVAPDKFTGISQRRCPICNGGIRKTNEVFLKELKIAGRERYTAMEDYKGALYKMKLKHLDCGNVFSTRPHDFLSGGNRCPECSSSRGEKKILDYLKDNNIEYKQEYRISECRFIRPLPFDFAILDNNELVMLIEYDGEGHFKPFRFSSKEKMSKKLKATQRNDNIKNNYCSANNIKLLRIPYTEHSNIETILKSVIP